MRAVAIVEVRGAVGEAVRIFRMHTQQVSKYIHSDFYLTVKSHAKHTLDFVVVGSF